MPTIYHYYHKGNKKRKVQLSSFGAALAMARHDIEYQHTLYETIKIEAEGITYHTDDIMSLTDLDCRGGIIVKLPVLLR